MGFAIGFGSTEQSFEDAEEAAFKEFARKRYRELGCDYVTDDLAGEVRRWVEDRAAAYRTESEVYKTDLNHPDRYSHYYVHILNDASFIVAIFRFSHTNRRHALSPDGWALLQFERLACFSTTRDA